MACMCGDIMCPSCGTAQGYSAGAEYRDELCYALFEQLPDAVNLEWFISYICKRLSHADAKPLVEYFYGIHHPFTEESYGSDYPDNAPKW